MMQNAHGRFPFGQPNTERPMRLPAQGLPSALVLGVYPSAFHIGWRAGDQRISALAVDVEPTVFWNGTDPNPDVLLDEWLAAVRHRADWGAVTVSRNGPSGSFLEDELLRPLGFDPKQVAFTDAVPWFFVKDGKGSQAAATRDRFRPFAEAHRIHPGSLPARPKPAGLVEIVASTERRESLTAEVVRAAAPCLITLGNEALAAATTVADRVDGVPGTLTPDDYGAVGSITIGGHTMEFRPLAHPGLLRQQIRPDGAAATRWRQAHERWKQDLGG